MLNIQRIVCNMFQENCYIVSDDTKECVIIDCGAFYEEEKKEITNYIRDNQLIPNICFVHMHILIIILGIMLYIKNLGLNRKYALMIKY